MDQFTNGFPILQTHGMHATFFVNTGPILVGADASAPIVNAFLRKL